MDFLALKQYQSPEWAANLKQIPKQKYDIAQVPTPIHPFNIPAKIIPSGQIQFYIKRDDLTGMQLSGNKVRKLEFLLPMATENKHDCVITLGGIQSNHCRATAVASRYLGLDTHLILRAANEDQAQNPGFVGNLLVDRMVGAQLHMVTKNEYTQYGQVKLAKILQENLQQKGLNPYIIPVGGSNWLGTWGYIQFFAELLQQIKDKKLDITDIVMACGSGATSGGIALGAYLSKSGIKVTAFAVCDDEDYFYDFIDDTYKELGVFETTDLKSSREILTVVQAKGAGYSISKPEELDLITQISQSTGIILDPVYTGKALKGLVELANQNSTHFKGKNVLFLHSGGLLGIYDKVSQIYDIENSGGKVSRLKL